MNKIIIHILLLVQLINLSLLKIKSKTLNYLIILTNENDKFLNYYSFISIFLIFN
jgi:hypothetical protein